MTTDRIEQAAPDVREVGLYGPNGLLARFTEMAGAIKKSAEECKAIGTSTSQAATIAALQAELAEAQKMKDQLMIAAAATVKGSMDEYKRGYADAAREVPGRIGAWLRRYGSLEASSFAASIEAHDWSKP